nr:glycosyltransferase [Lachnospiraceae bacterium]
MTKRILSITAQKPNSTGSGVYLTELVKAYAALGYEQAVIAGIEQGEEVELGQEISFYPVHFKSDEVPFPVVGMSDVMPYDNTRYCDMTDAMTAVFMEAFKKRIVKAIKEFCPDVILCHHLYLVTALTKSLAGEIPVYGICHSTCLRQFQKNALQKEFIAENIRNLDGIFALHKGQKEEIVSLFQVPNEKVYIVGAGYNDSIFYMEETGKEPGIHLCFAGKISQAKGVKSLLKSLSMVHTAQNVTLELAGGSADAKEVKELQNL